MMTKVENDNFSLINNNEKFSLINNNEKTLIKTDYPVKIANFTFDRDKVYLTSGNLFLDGKNASKEIINFNNMYNNIISEYRNAIAFYAFFAFKVSATRLNWGKGAVRYSAALNLDISKVTGEYVRSYINLYLFGPNNKLLYEKKINGDIKEKENINKTFIYKDEYYVNDLYDYRYDFDKKTYEYTLRIESTAFKNESKIEIIKLKNPLLNKNSYVEDVKKKMIIAYSYIKS